MGLEVTLKMVLLAALVSGAICGLFAYGLRSSVYAAWAAPIAVALGFIAGFWIVESDLALVPTISEGAKGSFPHIAVLAAVAGLIADRFPTRRWLWWLVAAIVSVLSSYLMFRAAIEFAWSPAQATLRVALSSLGMFVTLLFFRSFAQAAGPRLGTFNLSLIAALAAPAVLFADVLSGAQISGALAVAVGVVFLFSLITQRRIVAGSVGVVVGAVLWAVWMMGFLLAEMPPATLVLLSLALPSAFASRRLCSRVLKPRVLVAVQILAVVLPVAGAVGIGAKRYFAAPAQETGHDLAPNDGYEPGYGY